MKYKTVLAFLLSLTITMIMGCGKDGGSNQITAIGGDTQTGTSNQSGSTQDGTSISDPNQTNTGDVSSGQTGTNDVSSGQTGTSGDGIGQTVQPKNVSLSWDAPATYVDGTLLTDLAGFKVYYGTSSGVYTQVTDVRNVTSYSTGTLGPGTYYFAVTAYDSYGSESQFSNEISTTIL